MLIWASILRLILKMKKSLNKGGNKEMEPMIKRIPGINHLLKGIEFKLLTIILPKDVEIIKNNIIGKIKIEIILGISLFFQSQNLRTNKALIILILFQQIPNQGDHADQVFLLLD